MERRTSEDGVFEDSLHIRRHGIQNVNVYLFHHYVVKALWWKETRQRPGKLPNIYN